MTILVKVSCLSLSDRKGSALNLGSSAEAMLIVAFSSSVVYLLLRSWLIAALMRLTKGESPLIAGAGHAVEL